MKAFCNDLIQLHSVSLIVPKGGSARVELDDFPPALTFTIKFESNDPAATTPRMDFKIEASNALVVTGYNFHSPFASFNDGGVPLKLGTYNNREFFFSYIVWFLAENTGHKCELYFYSGKTVNP